MSVLNPTSHTARIAAGDAVIAAAATTDTRPVRAKLEAFRKHHAALTRATAALEEAEKFHDAAQRALGECDTEQDAAVEALATALVAIGQPRTSPFKAISNLPPSRVATLGYTAEADALETIARKARKLPRVDAGVRAACGDAERIVRALRHASKAVERFGAKVAEARTRRDALTQPWETGLAALKRVTRVAEDDGAKGLFAALFEVTAPAKKPRAKKPAPTG